MTRNLSISGEKKKQKILRHYCKVGIFDIRAKATTKQRKQ